MERNQMIFFRSYLEAGMCIKSAKERLQFFEAIVELALNGREIPLSGMANAIFLGIKPNIMQSVKRAQNRAAKNEKTPDISGVEEIDDLTDGTTDGMTDGMTDVRNKIEIEDSAIAALPSIGEGEGIGEGKGKGIGLGEGAGIGEGEGGTSAVPAEPRAHTERVFFVPPSVDEVRLYCAERGNSVDPERFVNYYTACGWVVGKHPMRDWRAAVRAWESNGISDEKPRQQGDTGSSYDPDAFFAAAARKFGGGG